MLNQAWTLTCSDEIRQQGCLCCCQDFGGRGACTERSGGQMVTSWSGMGRTCEAGADRLLTPDALIFAAAPGWVDLLSGRRQDSNTRTDYMQLVVIWPWIRFQINIIISPLSWAWWSNGKTEMNEGDCWTRFIQTWQTGWLNYSQKKKLQLNITFIRSELFLVAKEYLLLQPLVNFYD